MHDAPSQSIRVWDLPTRIFHWSLAVAAIGLLVTGKIGGDAMPWHARLGYCVGALLLFRLVWGFVGGHWSRFATFVPSPGRAWKYWRGDDPRPVAGHNALGALSIYAMLVFFAAQFASGLFSETKEDFSGPLSVLVSNATVHLLTGYHRNIGQVVLIGLVALHVAAIAYYLWRGENLVAPMIRGDKQMPHALPPSRDDARSRALALVLLSLCSLAIWGLLKLGS
jgi:cytochrome b